MRQVDTIQEKYSCTTYLARTSFVFLEVLAERISRRVPVTSCSTSPLSFTEVGSSTRTGSLIEDCNVNWTHAHNKTPRKAMLLVTMDALETTGYNLNGRFLEDWWDIVPALFIAYRYISRFIYNCIWNTRLFTLTNQNCFIRKLGQAGHWKREIIGNNPKVVILMQWAKDPQWFSAILKYFVCNHRRLVGFLWTLCYHSKHVLRV